jgi:signal transduction histidine kinase
LQHQQQTLGALVFTLSTEQFEALEKRDNLAATLRQQFATALHSQSDSSSNEKADQYQQAINETIHEASNPLSIVRNYLETLRIKLGDEHQANDNINLIKEEIDRVGSILLRLKNPETVESTTDQLNINQLIQNTAQIFKDSICATKQLSLLLKLDNKIGDVAINSGHLKQVLTNLLKNASEALPENGEILISSEASVSVGKKNYCAITVKDNGPGLPEEIKQHLFTPVTSTKGEGHSGLGLSIVKKLIDEMKGSVVCRSSGEGTEFQILIPKT